MQHRRHSFYESLTNVVLGFLLSWFTLRAILTLHLSANNTATLCTAVCTLWSFVRSYVVRRIFNWITYHA